MAYCDHCAYHTEADVLQSWIASTSETVESLTAGIDSLPKEQLDIILIKLDVTALNSLSLLSYISFICIYFQMCYFKTPG